MVGGIGHPDLDAAVLGRPRRVGGSARPRRRPRGGRDGGEPCGGPGEAFAVTPHQHHGGAAADEFGQDESRLISGGPIDGDLHIGLPRFRGYGVIATVGSAPEDPRYLIGSPVCAIVSPGPLRWTCSRM